MWSNQKKKRIELLLLPLLEALLTLGSILLLPSSGPGALCSYYKLPREVPSSHLV